MPAAAVTRVERTIEHRGRTDRLPHDARSDAAEPRWRSACSATTSRAIVAAAASTRGQHADLAPFLRSSAQASPDTQETAPHGVLFDQHAHIAATPSARPRGSDPDRGASRRPPPRPGAGARREARRRAPSAAPYAPPTSRSRTTLRRTRPASSRADRERARRRNDGTRSASPRAPAAPSLAAPAPRRSTAACDHMPRIRPAHARERLNQVQPRDRRSIDEAACDRRQPPDRRQAREVRLPREHGTADDGRDPAEHARGQQPRARRLPMSGVELPAVHRSTRPRAADDTSSMPAECGSKLPAARVPCSRPTETPPCPRRRC